MTEVEVAAAKCQAALPALAPPVPPALAAPSASACGHASSSSSQEAASHPDVEDTGRAPVQVPGSSASAGGSDGAAATRASLTLAPPPAVISLKSEPLQLAPQQPHAEQSPPPSSSGGDGELRVVIDSKERLRWSPALHQRFCQAVDSLGGCAVAKPKDIVQRMGVPGLTLAHVKSHLQKYRQQEGVTFVAHAPRAPASRRAASAGGFGDWEPSLKRSRSGGAAAHAPALPGFSTGPGNFWPAPAGQPAAAEPVQHFLQALAGSAPPPLPLPALPALPEAALPPMPAPEPARPTSPPAYEHAEKLHALADLALAQQEELLAAEASAQEAAEQLDGLGDRLGSVASASGSDKQQATAAGLQQPGSGVSSKADALLEQQQQLAAELSQHLAQQTGLLERLAALRRATDELLGRPELAAAAQPTAAAAEAGAAPLAAPPGAPAPAPAVAAAALRLAAEQAAASAVVPAVPLPAAAGAAVPAAGVAPQVASLLASIAAAAASGSAAGAVAPPAGVSMEEFLPLVQQQIQLQLQQRLFRLAA